MIRLPRPLRPHARVGLFAPSHPYDAARMAASVELLLSWGLVPVPAPNLGSRWRHFAGTDAQRLEDLTWALTNPRLDGAWMVRGGSGLPRLLDEVPWDQVPERMVIGFSDGTALLAALRARANLAGVHGPVAYNVSEHVDEASRQHLKRLIFGARSAQLPGRPLRKGSVEAPVVGGNLCVLASLCGTPHQLDARGCILLLEEVSEPPYKIDRMLEQLRQAGVFEGVLGVALGSFTGCAVPEGADYSVQTLFLEAVEHLGVPVVTGLPVGHGVENHAFFHGAMAHLDAEGLSWDLDPRA
ncbi:MAG: LD-carboxypeptidase [Alphaproteobacteria bacterium]|nr:LD-carboxypeptidase [Alphaproteobacteria bacterium]MCB9792586.1 LD-carboxypeptidase [Alphaproteobacteria bacterium]